MRTLWYASAAIILCLWLFPCAAQDLKGQPDSCGSCPPAKVSDLLTHRGIALTEGALVSALRSDDAEVRGLAAWQLQGEGARNAIPAIVAALEAERAPAQRVYITAALAQMKDDRGIQALRLDCNDSSLPMTYRLTSVMYLVMFHDDRSCWKAVAEGSSSKRMLEHECRPYHCFPISRDHPRSSSISFARCWWMDCRTKTRWSGSRRVTFLRRWGMCLQYPHSRQRLRRKSIPKCVARWRTNLVACRRSNAKEALIKPENILAGRKPPLIFAMLRHG